MKLKVGSTYYIPKSLRSTRLLADVFLNDFYRGKRARVVNLHTHGFMSRGNTHECVQAQILPKGAVLYFPATLLKPIRKAE